MPASRMSRKRVVLVLHEPAHRLERRFVLEPAVEQACARACTSGRPARGSSRRACRRGRCRGRPATRMRSGVEPPEPASPTGSISTTVEAELVLRSRVRIASPRRPPTSRCAVLPPPVRDREHLVRGEVAEPVAAGWPRPSSTPTTTSKGWSTARYSSRPRHDHRDARPIGLGDVARPRPRTTSV